MLVTGPDFVASPRLDGLATGRRLAWTQWDHPDMPWDAAEVWVGTLDDEGLRRGRAPGGRPRRVGVAADLGPGRIAVVHLRPRRPRPADRWTGRCRVAAAELPDGDVARRPGCSGCPLRCRDEVGGRRPGSSACPRRRRLTSTGGPGGRRRHRWDGHLRRDGRPRSVRRRSTLATRPGRRRPAGRLRRRPSRRASTEDDGHRPAGLRRGRAPATDERPRRVVRRAGRLRPRARPSTRPAPDDLAGHPAAPGPRPPPGADQPARRASTSRRRAGGRRTRSTTRRRTRTTWGPTARSRRCWSTSTGGRRRRPGASSSWGCSSGPAGASPWSTSTTAGRPGYGRGYRDLLKGQWGVVDVEDCVAAATFLADRGDVDPERMAIRGGSAGGFTTLAALAFHDTFAAGVSKYGVADLAVLAQDTHKFESRYLDSLVGPWPEAEALYRERSPLFHADQIRVPLLVLQGLEDEVVPPNQSELIVEALKANGVPVAYLAFEGEQHGFRKAETIVRAAEAELSFYGQVFGFDPEGVTDPVETDPVWTVVSDQRSDAGDGVEEGDVDPAGLVAVGDEDRGPVDRGGLDGRGVLGQGVDRLAGVDGELAEAWPRPAAARPRRAGPCRRWPATGRPAPGSGRRRDRCRPDPRGRRRGPRRPRPRRWCRRAGARSSWSCRPGPWWWSSTTRGRRPRRPRRRRCRR